VIITVIRDQQHRLIGFAKITRDLTRRREAEERIGELNTSLQLQNARLEIANKELESFSYSVYHDLRAPLRHIDGFASLLSRHAEKNLDEQGRRYLSVIAESARRMGRLIDDLLTFSRMGRVEMAVGVIDSNQLIDTIVNDGGLDRDSRITWKIHPLPPVTGDLAMLRQVWLNLLENAVKYTSKSPKPEVEIGSLSEAANPAEHVFYVKDNGVGFDMKYAAKLFGVFQRLHSESEFQGTGIGLANVRRIITRHGGRTWAESLPNAGATFFFSLPIAQVSPAPSQNRGA
jgi:light-regulated signal transduction histidine kinase (bacteriophytochrome)